MEFRYRVWAIFLAVAILVSCAVSSAGAVEFDVEAESALLVVPKTGQVLFSKNVDKQLPPASIAKIMTLLLVMEAVDSGRVSLSDQVRVSAQAEGMGGSQVWLKQGETFTLDQLLKAVAVPSANDAAVAVAEHVAGTVETFISAMNRRAQELGMTNTYFSNVTGLPPEPGEKATVTTARDISIMGMELLKHPKILDYTSIQYTVFRKNPRTDLWNTNKLIGAYDGADGLKTGYTEEAGFCLVATAEREGLRLLSVVLKTDSDLARQVQSERLLNYGFKGFAPMKAITKGEASGTIQVKNGVPEQITLVAASDLQVLVPHGRQEDVKKELVPNGIPQAPLEKGAKLGTYYVKLDGNTLGRVDAVAPVDVSRANWFTRLWRWIRDLVKSLVSFGRK